MPNTSSRRAPLAIAVLALLALAIAWTLWSAPERTVGSAEKARPERAEPTSERPTSDLAPARVEPAAEREPDAKHAAPSATIAAASTAAAVPAVAAAPDASASLTNVHVRVLGIEPGERALVEARVYGKDERHGAHVLRAVDERGEVAFALPPGLLRLGAWTKTSIATHAVTMIGTEPKSFELQLERAGIVSGRVSHALTGLPLEGARITLLGQRELDAARSGPDGRYELAIPADGMGRPLRCEADGFAREETTAGVHGDGRWHASSPGQTDLAQAPGLRDGPPLVDFVLLPARTITGELRAAQGAAAGAAITALGHMWTAKGLAFPDRAEAVSTDSGHFTLSGLRPDLDHHVTVTLAGHAQLQVRVPPSLEVVQDLGLLRMEVARELEARVVNHEGLPVEDLIVVLELPLPTAQNRRIPTQDEFPRNALRFAKSSGARKARTDAEGIARLTELPSGMRSVYVVESFAPTPACAPVSVDVGAEARVELRLEGTVSMSGHVLANGQPVAGARLHLREGAHRKTLTQADGSFRFTGLDPAPAYELYATWTDAQGVGWSSEQAPADWREPQVIVLRAKP